MNKNETKILEIIAGVCFVASSLFLSGMTGAVIGDSGIYEKTYGLVFLFFAVILGVLYVFAKSKENTEVLVK